MKHKLVQTVAETIAAFGMLDAGARVVVGLSGGADSVALTLALQTLGYEVRALHLNHQLRGAEATRDAQFVEAFCKARGIPLCVEARDIAAISKRDKRGIEETARCVRYALLDAHAQGDKIATAHTANDNTETVLFHLTRGSAGRGLCGIPPVRGDVIRPLLAVTRAEVEAFLEEQGQPYMTDSTNADNQYARNKVRHEVVPVLTDINPRLHETVLRMSQQLRQMEDDADARVTQALAQARQAYGYDVRTLKRLPQSDLARAVKQICVLSGVPESKLTAKHVEAVCVLLQATAPNGTLHLPGKCEAVRAYDTLAVGARAQEDTQDGTVCAITGAGDYRLFGKTVRVYPAEKNTRFNKSFNTFLMDCDTIEHGSVVIRGRRAGDRIRLRQGGGSRTLKKLMIERKIALRARDTSIVIADDNGIIAVEGIGQQNDRKPVTNNVMVIEIQGDTTDV